MNSVHHFYLTFNPSLNQTYEKGYTQCHEFYDLLKDELTKAPTSTLYWGKMISKERSVGFDIELFQKIIEQNKENFLSTHLFITDFQNLWVGKVKSVIGELPKGAKTLPFYTDKKVEAWFEIEDFFLLEHENEGTAKKLSEFYIDHEYSELKIKGLSPFTTSVKYPCILQDRTEEQFFDQLDTAECSHLIFKNNPAVLMNSSNVILKNIHAYLFPEAMYAKLPHAAKLEIEAAEMDMLESRHHNIHKMTFSYIQALEVVLNDLVVHHLKRKGQGNEIFVDASSSPARLYFDQTKDFYIPLKQHQKNFSINNILNFVERGAAQNAPAFRMTFSNHKGFIQYLVKELAPIIQNNKLIAIRNSLAHGESEGITFKDAMAVRSLILGCGANGLIFMCYQRFYPDLFKSLSEVTEFDKGMDAKAKLKLVG